MAKFFTNAYNKVKAKIKANKAMIICSVLICIFIAIFFYDRIFITIRAGHQGVLFKRFLGGTVLDQTYGEGWHAILPWDYMYVYNVRIQETRHHIEVLSKEGLRFHIDLSIRYHPEKKFLGYLHARVGPNYVNSIVKPEIQSVIRTIVGKFTPAEVYTTKRGLINKSIFSAFSELSQKYIVLDDVIIKDVILPKSIEMAIEHKLKAEQMVAEYEFLLQREEKEKERKRIEAEGIQLYQYTISKSLTENLLKWQGIQATLQLAESHNTKIVVIGRSDDGLPIILDMKQDTNVDNIKNSLLDLEKDYGLQKKEGNLKINIKSAIPAENANISKTKKVKIKKELTKQ